jgi:hypothetical protein
MVEAIEPIEAFKPGRTKSGTAFFVKGGVAAPWRAANLGTGFLASFTGSRFGVCTLVNGISHTG